MKKNKSMKFLSKQGVKKMQLVLILVSLGCIFGCVSTKNSFISIDKTLGIYPKMTKDSTLKKLGIPAEVRAGIVLTNGTVCEIWYYQYSERLSVKTSSKYSGVFFPGPDNPSDGVSGSDKDSWGSPHPYALYFLNGLLVKWGYPQDDWLDYDKSDGEILAPVLRGIDTCGR